jgi:molecular chaperone DnaK (HSP70)
MTLVTSHFSLFYISTMKVAFGGVLLLVLTNCYVFSAFLPQNRVTFSSSQLRQGLAEDKNGFEMPSADELISDIPEDQRGIGVGIDLGTTNSAASILTKDGLPKIVNIRGKSTIPSVVSLWKEEGGDLPVAEFNVGGEGETSVGDDSVFTYRHVKRVIGMGTTTAACSAEVVPYLAIQTAAQRRKGRSMNRKNKKEGLAGLGLVNIMKEAKENPIRLNVPQGISLRENEIERNEEDDSTTTSPEFISSRILKTLFESVEEQTGERITRAVIGVPAYFNDIQRDATIRVSLTRMFSFQDFKLRSLNKTLVYSFILGCNIGL